MAISAVFSPAQYMGEKCISGIDCFVLKLSADLADLADRSDSTAEMIKHVVFGYFSQRSGLLVYLEDSYLTRIQSPGSYPTYWETTIATKVEDYRMVDGVMIAHGGQSSVMITRFGDNLKAGLSITRMEETWSIDDIAFNVEGLSMDCFIPPKEPLAFELQKPQSQKKQLLAFSAFSSEAANEKPRPPPIRVGLTESAGRGVFATRRIGAGDLIHTAKPIVAHPSLSGINTVCYFCLKKLNLTDFKSHSVAFCSSECEVNAKVFYDVETKEDWQAFDDYCRTQGLKYPLLVKRLACMVISGAASAESLDILQPASLSRDMILEMEEGFGLLRSGFVKANIADELIAFLTKQWYINMLARIRINAFRIELAVGLHEDLLSSAAACIEAEVAVGNAVYMLPSFYNHDCENADARLKALRDIEAGSSIVGQLLE
ncbi:hypothetical protein GH714_037115 [Hevea brasiliensis]|uniref:SET domain-containing protein n=1 Tax=Hevea brasiliensis TaxID=3981 RepID=A0A6A6KKV1_HEVBR|nr:hypothetical protein GH714_037115 [Hevea brasiliensis]